MGFWDKFVKREQALEGVPGHPRRKTYSAESGFVYQYLFQGWRRTDGTGYEYVFAVSRPRHEPMSLAILLAGDVLREWEKSQDRSLSSSERYGLAKMGLLDLLDREEHPDSLPEEFRPVASDLQSYANRLDL